MQRVTKEEILTVDGAHGIIWKRRKVIQMMRIIKGRVTKQRGC